jgi:hypothetical protein
MRFEFHPEALAEYAPQARKVLDSEANNSPALVISPGMI